MPVRIFHYNVPTRPKRRWTKPHPVRPVSQRLRDTLVHVPHYCAYLRTRLVQPLSHGVSFFGSAFVTRCASTRAADSLNSFTGSPLSSIPCSTCSSPHPSPRYRSRGLVPSPLKFT